MSALRWLSTSLDKERWVDPRWLLPFTQGGDMRAIDYLVSLAGNNGATLVPVSLVSVMRPARAGGARLEHIQQSKDFLEAVQYKAARHQVPIERYEHTQLHEFSCFGIEKGVQRAMLGRKHWRERSTNSAG